MRKRETMPDDLAYQEAHATLKSLAGWAEDEDFADEAAEQERPEEKSDDSPSETQPMHAEDRAEFWPDKTWRDLIEALPDGVVVISKHGTIVLVNAQTEKIFGYNREELLGWKIEKLIPRRFTNHVGKRDEYFGKEEPETKAMGARQQQLFGRRKDGAEFPVDINLSPLRTEQGMFATSVIRDITQRKREEAKFKTLVENIPAVTFFAPLDESAPELYVSPQIQKLLGFTAKEWLEDPVLWHRQLHAEDRETWNKQFAPTCATGEPFEKTYRFIAKDGRVVWVHGSASVVRDADGTPSFLQGVAFDITEIKEAEEAMRKAEAALRQSNAELDQRVQERTGELEHFAYVASHDLSDPLRTLKNCLDILDENYRGKVDPQFDPWIGETIESANRMKQLILLLLDYSRVVRRKKILTPTNALRSAKDARANLQAAIQESGARVTLDKELPTVLGNHEELVLLFQNLISNAIKFRAPDRPIQVKVDARAIKNGWLLRVRDNGIGIETRFHKKIGAKEPKLFSLGVEGRVHPSSFKVPGHGYGLHNCKKIVTGHGGVIRVKSKFGKGSTFFFTLPAVPLPK